MGLVPTPTVEFLNKWNFMSDKVKRSLFGGFCKKLLSFQLCLRY